MKRRSFLRLLGSTALAAWAGPVQLGGPTNVNVPVALDEHGNLTRAGFRDAWAKLVEPIVIPWAIHEHSEPTQMSTAETDPVISMSIVHTDEVPVWESS